jgi:hypothetical protein
MFKLWVVLSVPDLQEVNFSEHLSCAICCDCTFQRGLSLLPWKMHGITVFLKLAMMKIFVYFFLGFFTHFRQFFSPQTTHFLS